MRGHGVDRRTRSALLLTRAASQQLRDCPDFLPCPWGGCETPSRVTNWKEDSNVTI